MRGKLRCHENMKIIQILITHFFSIIKILSLIICAGKRCKNDNVSEYFVDNKSYQI